MSESPYQPPQHQSQPFGQDMTNAPRPGVMTGYTVYCLLMALLYLLVAGFGIALAMDTFDLGEGPDADEARMMGVVLPVVGVPLFLLFAAAPFLPRKPWAWIFGFVPIGIGMTSICTLPFCIALLIYWLKPEVKNYFGKV